jgi:hypothetical protein
MTSLTPNGSEAKASVYPYFIYFLSLAEIENNG